ncbi:MAG: hypothetical protein JWL72_1050 [Ilumatobacteraceae bacterium]|nr:hypothetical protein [Ilumatobacteraceae bacterium]
MSANTLSLGGSKRSSLSSSRPTSATAHASGRSPRSPGGDGSEESGALTTGRLYRFGAIIGVAIIAVVGFAMWGSSNQSSALAERNKIAATRDFVFQADMLHDAIRATVFGSALTSQTGQPDVDALQAELKESVPQFTQNIQGAIDLNDDPQIVADLTGILPEVTTYGDDSLKLSLAWDDLGSNDATVRAAAKADYTAWLATFNSLKDKMAAVEDAIDVKSKTVLSDADSSGTKSETIVIIGALIALGVFAFVWRKVLKATARMNVLQAEMLRVTQMMENSPTNMMFCDHDLIVRYMNPALLGTLRKLQAHLPCNADDVVGSSIDIFHTNPHHQRDILANQDRRLPMTSQIAIGPETLELSISAIKDKAGNSIGSMATWTLVTEQLRLEREAEDSREREKTQAAESLERDRQQQERERTEAAEVLAKEQTAAAELQGRVDQLLVALAGAAAGDLTIDVPVSSDDAVGQMGVALRKLLSDLRVSVSSIASNSEALAAAAEEFQVVSEQMGSNSAETSNQVNLVTQATSEVSRNVEILSTGAEQMSASIKEIAKNASDAAKVTGQAVEAAQSTNETVAKLGESSAEIGQIVKVITGIAQQTNLLALNATIEAARAGEAGKGFAVVANEVKELAKETALATEDISQKITAIQLDTGRSVDAIAGILMIINQIAEYQDTIASAVEEQAATTSEMARSVNDASRGSTEITANMQNVRDAANSTASGASDSQRAATELARMSSDLQALVAQFNY